MNFSGEDRRCDFRTAGAAAASFAPQGFGLLLAQVLPLRRARPQYRLR
jgi:adenylylsulfate kinase-like enzyme